MQWEAIADYIFVYGKAIFCEVVNNKLALNIFILAVFFVETHNFEPYRFGPSRCFYKRSCLSQY